MDSVRVMLMRRDDLSEEEAESLVSFFPTATEFVFERRDPVDFREHFAMCEEFQPHVVILPREKPVPILAMEKGYAHISFTPKGFMQLRSVPPNFVPYVPGQQLPKVTSDHERLNALLLASAIMRGECHPSPTSNISEIRAIQEMLKELERRLELQAA